MDESQRFIEHLTRLKVGSIADLYLLLRAINAHKIKITTDIANILMAELFFEVNMCLQQNVCPDFQSRDSFAIRISMCIEQIFLNDCLRDNSWMCCIYPILSVFKKHNHKATTSITGILILEEKARQQANQKSQFLINALLAYHSGDARFLHKLYPRIPTDQLKLHELSILCDMCFY